MINPEFVLSALTSEEFATNLARVADITEFEAVEAGFVMYRSADGAPVASQVIKASGNTALMHSYKAIAEPHVAITVSELVDEFDDDDNLVLRSDLGMFLHSHPGVHRLKRTEGLRPSTPDLKQYEELVLRNPGMVNGIIVVEEDLVEASLLLYRRADPNQPNRYQQLAGSPSRAAIFKAMGESGFVRTVMDFDPSMGIILGDRQTISLAVNGLFSSD
jgi:hypothetical protein